MPRTEPSIPGRQGRQRPQRPQGRQGRQGPGWVAAALAISCLAGTVLWPGPGDAQAQAQNDPADYQIELFTEPLALDPENGAKRIGGLTYVAGVVLVSDDRSFGGLSGLVINEAGDEMLAVSDRGDWLRAAITVSDGTIALSDVYLAPMLDWKEAELQPSEQDAEALALVDSSVIVAFEGFHRIWRYAADTNRSLLTAAFNTARPLAGGGALSDQPDNGGIESLAALGDGRLLAFSEEAKTPDGHNRAWLIGKGGEITALGFKAKPGYKPTDLARLPGGDLVVLQRRYTPMSGVAASIGRIAADSVTAGAVLEAEEIALLKPPMTVDNMEALAVHQIPDGRTRLFLLSDNNFNALQRTILVVFELSGPEGE